MEDRKCDDNMEDDCIVTTDPVACIRSTVSPSVYARVVENTLKDIDVRSYDLFFMHRNLMRFVTGGWKHPELEITPLMIGMDMLTCVNNACIAFVEIQKLILE